METDQFIYKKETYNIIGAAMDVHRTLGMGFLESVYQEAVSTILPEHEAQIINYIHATGIKLGMLLNFGEESLYFKRFPNITPKTICTNPQL